MRINPAAVADDSVQLLLPAGFLKVSVTSLHKKYAISTFYVKFTRSKPEQLRLAAATRRHRWSYIVHQRTIRRKVLQASISS